MTASGFDQAQLVESLMDPAAYPSPKPDSVERISTHISNVFLAGEFAYKVKKPVNFGFCDFSTVELRCRFSEREALLNTRLSHGVYLTVEPVNLDPATGKCNIGGAGEQIDCALKMRRLNADDQLDRLLERGVAGADEIRQIALLLAEFHSNAEPAPASFATVNQVSKIVLGNLERVAEHAPPGLDSVALADVSAYAAAFLDERGEMIARRHSKGAPRMCHGDLHTGNIFFESQPGGERSLQVIDCIEFNDDLIYIDPAADIAFLSMDLKRRGFQDLAAELISVYTEAAGDPAALPLLPFYESYRAMVRCLAASISAEQAHGQDRARHVKEANHYLDLACQIAANERPRFLAITAGVTGTGKSTVAGLVASQWGAVHLRTDEIRRELAGFGRTERTGSNVHGGIYTQDMSRQTYEEMHRRAKQALEAGESVIMDGTHLEREFRTASLAVAGERQGVSTIIVECSLDEAEALRRLETRYSSGESESEGRPEVYHRQLPVWQPPVDGEADIVARVNTGGGPDELAGRVFTALWNGVLATGQTG